MSVDNPTHPEGGGGEQLKSKVKEIAARAGFPYFIDLPDGTTQIFGGDDPEKIGPNFQIQTFRGKLEIVDRGGLSDSKFERLKQTLLKEYPDTKTITV